VPDWSGDPDPAATVGSRFSLSADVARRRHGQVTRQLQRLAADDQRYAPITELARVA
jgi:hypothetical protein